MSPDEYRTHQVNLLASRAVDTAMAYGHAERNHGTGEDGYRAIAQERLDKLTAIINELRDLALTDTAARERLTEQAYELSQVHEDNQRLAAELDEAERARDKLTLTVRAFPHAANAANIAHARAQRDEAWAWLPYETRCALTAKWKEQDEAGRAVASKAAAPHLSATPREEQ